MFLKVEWNKYTLGWNILYVKGSVKNFLCTIFCWSLPAAPSWTATHILFVPTSGEQATVFLWPQSWSLTAIIVEIFLRGNVCYCNLRQFPFLPDFHNHPLDNSHIWAWASQFPVAQGIMPGNCSKTQFLCCWEEEDLGIWDWLYFLNTLGLCLKCKT
jgi:hypothetical protein